MKKYSGARRDIQRRSWGLAIFANGTSSKRAQEHSTTANPACSIISRSAGLTGRVPLGLREARANQHSLSFRSKGVCSTYVTTIPWKRGPTLSSLMSRSCASFLPEQRRGSQWSKSLVRLDSSRCDETGGGGIGHLPTLPLEHLSFHLYNKFVNFVVGFIRDEGESRI